MVLARFATVAGTMAVMVGGMLGAAGHAVAADDDPTYVMPDITGMDLDDATAAVTDLNPDFKLQSRNINGTQDPLVLSNWTVCWQYPKADTEFSGKTWMGAGATRKGTDCWG